MPSSAAPVTRTSGIMTSLPAQTLARCPAQRLTELTLKSAPSTSIAAGVAIAESLDITPLITTDGNLRPETFTRSPSMLLSTRGLRAIFFSILGRLAITMVKKQNLHALDFYAFNMSTQTLKPFYKVFVAAFNLVNITYAAFSLGCKCCNYHCHSGTNIRGNEMITMK